VASLLNLFFNPEDGGDIFLRNVGWHSAGYAVLYPRRLYSSQPPLWVPQIIQALPRDYRYCEIIRYLQIIVANGVLCFGPSINNFGICDGQCSQEVSASAFSDSPSTDTPHLDRSFPWWSLREARAYRHDIEVFVFSSGFASDSSHHSPSSRVG
jgi:hypothetical protein